MAYTTRHPHVELRRTGRGMWRLATRAQPTPALLDALFGQGGLYGATHYRITARAQDARSGLGIHVTHVEAVS